MSADRRSATRFDVRLTLRYTAMRSGEAPITGSGESIDVSRTGLLFRAAEKLNNNDSLIVILDWPFLAPNGEVLKLVLTGQVVRTKDPLIGVAVYSHRLLREREIESRFESFLAPAERIRERSRADARRVLLVDDDEATVALLSLVIDPENWRIERVGPATATAILGAGDPPVQLVLTRTIDVFRQVSEEIPVIFIAEESGEVPEAVAARPGRRAVLHKPFQDADFRRAIDEALGVESLKTGSAGRSG